VQRFEILGLNKELDFIQARCLLCNYTRKWAVLRTPFHTVTNALPVQPHCKRSLLESYWFHDHLPFLR
jgi:hypothetical protein